MSQKIGSKAKAKGFITGFKNFIMKGNIVDMAIGVIIGGAFGKIVTSLINDIILPPIGVLLGGVDFKDLRALIYSAPVLDDAGNQVIIGGVAQFSNVYISYGNFIQVVLEFIIIAFSIYMLLFFVIKKKQIEEEIAAREAAKLAENQAPEPEVPAEVTVPEDIKLLTEIRDLLSKK